MKLYKADIFPVLAVLCIIPYLWSCTGHPRWPSVHNGWSNNIRVMASGGQHRISYGRMYINALINKLQDPKIAGLEAAQDSLEGEGYTVVNEQIYPASSARRLGSWQKSERQKQRFALLISGAVNVEFGGGGKYDFNIDNLSNFKASLKAAETYGLAEDHILRIDHATPQQIDEGLTWLRDRLLLSDNAEGLVLYAGHGGQSSFPWPWDGEGDTQGYLEGPNMKESQIKDWINYRLGTLDFPGPDGKTRHPILFILESCFSGAFVAEARD